MKTSVIANIKVLFLFHRLLFYRGPTVREKSVKNEKSSRSGKGQGILS